MSDPSSLGRHFRLRSATALVIANIIGAGVFTSTGFQAADLPHPGFIFLLWVVGGALALCGAWCYAELGAAFPEAGGEYVYLRETYGDALAFMSAFVSLVAGFSAPVASATKGVVEYLRHFVPALEHETRVLGILELKSLVAIGLVWLLVLVHARGARRGIAFNDLITLFKVAGIVAIVLVAFALGNGSFEHFTHVSPRFAELSNADRLAAFGTSLVFVMFCYSGWNAAAYVAGEMENPQRDLPRALLLGTGIVVALYLALNAVYFYGADVDELAGHADVGLVAAEGMLGSGGTTLLVIVLCVSILASASAMTIAGPRVYFALGRRSPSFAFLARTGPDGSPRTALVLQGVVTTIVILSGRIDQIQQYAGFTLMLFASLAVSCVIVLRVRRPDLPRPYRAFGYPVTPVLFLAVSLWMMVCGMRRATG